MFERERDGITNAHLLDDIHFLMGFHVKPLYKNVKLQSLVEYRKCNIFELRERESIRPSRGVLDKQTNSQQRISKEEDDGLCQKKKKEGRKQVFLVVHQFSKSFLLPICMTMDT